MNESGNDCEHCVVSGESTNEPEGVSDCQHCAVSGESANEPEFDSECQHRAKQHGPGHLHHPVLLLASGSCGHHESTRGMCMCVCVCVCVCE